jgi:hypothetical protein
LSSSRSHKSNSALRAAAKKFSGKTFAHSGKTTRMNPTTKSLGVLLFASLLAAGPASQPTSQPAMQSMSNDQIHFVAPDAPWVAKAVKAPDTAYYQTTKGDSALQAQWAPKDFELSPDTDDQFAVQISKDLKKKHQDTNTEMVLAPKILKDKRFDIVIHEQFKISKDITEDELHIYKSVGPRVMMVVVSCVSDDPTVIDAAHKAAEDMLDSCKFNRKAFKKGN